MNKFALLLTVAVLGLSACTKSYRCECKNGNSPIVSYKSGEEVAAKKQCEDAGCSFVQY